jgi:hypothetical protein
MKEPSQKILDIFTDKYFQKMLGHKYKIILVNLKRYNSM